MRKVSEQSRWGAVVGTRVAVEASAVAVKVKRMFGFGQGGECRCGCVVDDGTKCVGRWLEVENGATEPKVEMEVEMGVLELR